jgi:hypothetical protein
MGKLGFPHGEIWVPPWGNLGSQMGKSRFANGVCDCQSDRQARDFKMCSWFPNGEIWAPKLGSVGSQRGLAGSHWGHVCEQWRPVGSQRGASGSQRGTMGLQMGKSGFLNGDGDCQSAGAGL